MRWFAVVLAMAILGMPVRSFACGPEIEIHFAEASPDQFRISFVRGPQLTLERLEIRLAGSAAGAVFDDYTGLDLQSPSPTGAAITAILYAPPPDMTVTLTFKNFLEKHTLDFRSDLDDSGRASDIDQNHLTIGELEGATARAILRHADGRAVEIDGRFDRDNKARLGERACV